MEAVSVLDAVAERITRGQELTSEDAGSILATHDIVELGMLADGVRRQRHDKRTTFGRVLEVHVDAVPEALPAKFDGGEVRIIGTPTNAEAGIAAVRAASGIAGATPVAGFSIADLARLGGSDVATFFARLQRSGLHAVADAAVDDPGDVAAAVRAARNAGLRVLRLTNHAGSADAQVQLVNRARALQAELGGFRAFAPLPRTMSIALPTTGYDDVKLIALARLVVNNIDSIQVDWALYGPKLAQVALTMGADDVDGVAAVETGELGTRRNAIEEITRNIRAAALEPQERTGLFETRLA
jgi:aminodeoxyfutalosine synthase